MEISVKNKNGRTSIDVFYENVNYRIETDENYDVNGNQHISSSIIDASGFPNPILDKKIIIRELSRNGIIVDNE